MHQSRLADEVSGNLVPDARHLRLGMRPLTFPNWFISFRKVSACMHYAEASAELAVLMLVILGIKLQLTNLLLQPGWVRSMEGVELYSNTFLARSRCCAGAEGTPQCCDRGHLDASRCKRNPRRRKEEVSAGSKVQAWHHSRHTKALLFANLQQESIGSFLRPCGRMTLPVEASTPRDLCHHAINAKHQRCFQNLSTSTMKGTFTSFYTYRTLKGGQSKLLSAASFSTVTSTGTSSAHATKPRTVLARCG